MNVVWALFFIGAGDFNQPLDTNHRFESRADCFKARDLIANQKVDPEFKYFKANGETTITYWQLSQEEFSDLESKFRAERDAYHCVVFK